jgi:hypothetical protein
MSSIEKKSKQKWSNRVIQSNIHSSSCNSTGEERQNNAGTICDEIVAKNLFKNPDLTSPEYIRNLKNKLPKDQPSK